MNVLVCVKRVPDTESQIKVDGSGEAIDPSGVKFILSPYDVMAVEAGLRAKEAAGSGSVTVLSFGDSGSAETLRTALAMGADQAVHLEGAVSFDGMATAKVLASECENSDADLILLGVKAADDDQQQVGPMLATLLDRPCVTGVSDFTIEGEQVVVRREVEGGVESIEVDLPAVLSITKGAFEPRRASLQGIMAAKRKPLEQRAAPEVASRLVLESLAPPPERPEGRVVGEGPDTVPELVRLLREEAKVL